MITSMEHERSYTSGCYLIPELGVHAGWIAHEGCFLASQPFVNETGDVVLLFSGECFIDPETRAELRGKGIASKLTTIGWFTSMKRRANAFLKSSTAFSAAC